MVKEKNSFSKSEFTNLKTYFELLDHLTNKDEFYKFKSKFYSELEYIDIHHSYLFFICCIIDKIC